MNQISALHHWAGELICGYGLYLAQKNTNIVCLVNFQTGDTTEYAPIARIPIPILRRFSDSLNLPLFTVPSSSESLEKDIPALLSLVNQKYGVHSIIFNDFGQNSWTNLLKQKYREHFLEIHNFLNEKSPESLFEDALALGFKSHIFSVNEKMLNRSYLGAEMTMDMLKKFKNENIHPFGANGEFYTVCVDGPNFKNKISLNFGDIHFKNGHWYREMNFA